MRYSFFLYLNKAKYFLKFLFSYFLKCPMAKSTQKILKAEKIPPNKERQVTKVNKIKQKNLADVCQCMAEERKSWLF